jgi:hypothetical protein
MVPHYDEMTLALLALGESAVTDDDEQHLSTCVLCRHEVDVLGQVVATGRSLSDEDYPATPSSAVWDRIQEQVRGELATGEASPTMPSLTSVTSATAASSAARTQRPRNVRWGLGLAAAAAVGLLVGAGATWSLTRSTTPTPPVSQGQVSVAALHPLDDPGAQGTAVLTTVSAQRRTISVSVANLPAQPGTFYEVWLMDPSNAHLVSLGVLDQAGHGEYAVPAGLDLTMYSAVDVSLQPMNGSPAHSKNSAVRGTITA